MKKTTETNSSAQRFPGFPPKRAPGNFWCYPNIACMYWHDLSGAENKVLDCLLRHMWGFGRSSDRVSLSQLQRGVNKIHRGTGLSRKGIIRALRSLEEKGFITSVKSSRTNQYSLVTSVHQEHGTKGNKSSVPMSPATGDESTPVASVESTHTTDTKIERTIKRLYEAHSQFILSGKKLPMTRKAREKIRDRLSECDSYHLYIAIRNASENDYWKPIVETSTLAWFFDSEERISRFLALGPYSPERPLGKEKSDVSAS